MRYRKIYALLLATMVTAGVATTQNAMAQTSTGVKIHGSVYGGGNAADVKVNTTVNIGDGNVEGNVYGGGKIGSVGTFTYYTGDGINASNYISSCADGTGTATVNISGGTVGNEDEYTYDADNTLKHTSGGNVFAGSKGKLEEEGSTAANPLYVTDWYKHARVKNTVLTVSGGIIKSNVYGGGEIGAVGFGTSYGDSKTTDIRISGGTIGTEIQSGSGSEAATQYTFGSVFGAGYGSNLETTIAGQTDPNAPKLFAGRVYGNTSVLMTDGTVKASVYGGGELASVSGNATVAVSGGTIGKAKVGDKQFGGPTMGNVYGGGSGDKNIVRAGQIFGNTTVNISQASGKTTNIYHNIYGGGAYGSVGTYTYTTTTTDPNYPGIEKVTEVGSCTSGGTATVTITGGTIGTDGIENGMVFGSSRGDVGAPGTRDDLVAWVNTANVTIGTESSTTGPTIKGSIYGSGENGHTLGNTDVKVHSGTIGVHDGSAADKTRGNVYGGGCGTDKYYSTGTEKYDGKGDSYNPKAGIVEGTTTVTIDGGHVLHNVYGAGAMGSVGTADVATSGKTTVTISGGRIGVDGNENGNVFGAARGEYGTSTVLSKNLANVRETEVNINYTTTPAADNTEKTVQLIAGSVFGGGEAGTVKESVAVNMTGGLILKDIYGGGALADTQTSNWDASANSGAGYWATGKSSASATTTVRLMGGRVVEEVYGGGLGEANKPAFVWGDVLVDLNGTTTLSGGKATANGTKTTNATGCAVGQIFGGNNINGTPKGDVMVHVYATQNAAATQIANATASGTEGQEGYTPAVTTAKVKGRYDVMAVYGGGNQAAYIPVTPNTSTTSTPNGSQTQVIIEGCDYTSVETVYGGGNAAAVPETNVEVRAAYEIGTVFGGGNGYSATDNHTNPEAANYNPGADVGTKDHGASTANNYGTGNVNTVLKGGLIHEAYGGSNQMGKIVGKVNINTAPVEGGCDLCVDKLVGAGKNADVDGDLIMILGCKPSTKTPLVFAGADNADVNGNVELTITSGTFGQVFGGNNLGGYIKGHIKLNIEETGCTPIKIDELYLGGNQAAYSRYGYYLDASDNKVKPRTAAMSDPQAEGYKEAVAGRISVPYDEPELNVISCTSIGKVFGGGWGEGAVMYADPTVNINMIKGTATGSLSTLGTIGDVFGGGNAAAVMGNTTVNIGTETTVTLTSIEDDSNTTEVNESLKTVLGANITGNVFGGGNEAKVSGNTYVNICGSQQPDSDAENGYIDTSVDHTGTTGFAVSIGNSVYGGGNKADVEGNTFVTMADGYVFNGIFGGGLAGSVGMFERDKTVTLFGHTPNHEGCIGKPTACTSGGTCYVVVSGGRIGPDEVATENMGMKRPKADGGPVPQGWVWGAGCGIVEDPATNPDTHFKAYVNNTDVTIKGNAFILESIIGGGEFGRVFGNTLVKIKGGQIGAGYKVLDGNGKPKAYTEAQWTAAETALRAGNATNLEAAALTPCSHFDFGEDTNGDNKKDRFLSYDPYYDDYNSPAKFSPASTASPSDGKTWIGCVFAGGSGYMPYKNTSGYDWIPSAGWVEGNTELRISGGHILTNVYGGNEYTSVGTEGKANTGKCTVKMTGGTIGVPRTKAQIEALPMSGYLFGAGKGDPRSRFDTFTNVKDVEIEVSGGIIYGSVYGGSEDGHVLGDVDIKIKKNADSTKDPIIGTWGTSYFDGHVFGGGRGFSGENPVAGAVGGNVDITIEGGKILGSVYGGGRMGSVGLDLSTTTQSNGDVEKSSNFGNLQTTGTKGETTINISGGIVGNENATGDGAQYSGNVFGASMGRLDYLNGTRSDIWPKMAQVRSTAVNIYKDAIIRRSVYGGGELGTVRDDAYVTIGGYKTADADAKGDVTVTASLGTTGPIVRRDVFGGGYGSIDRNHTVFTVNESGTNNTYAFTPMQFAGSVGKNTYVNVAGGYIRKSVYGGGEMASVGVINYRAAELTSGTSTDGKVTIGPIGGKTYYYTNMVKHADPTTGFALSWPYKFEYVDGYPGETHVKVTGGRLGLKDNDSDTGFDDNGDVYGAGKGMAGDFKDYLFCANVGSTNVVIDHASSNNLTEYSGSADLIAGAVYGGGEDGHVMGNTQVTMSNGFVYHSIYGAGSGKGKYEGRLLKIGASEGSTTESDYYTRSVYSITAGKVFGNSTVEMSGGTVVRNVYGGGNMGSVGKGNYAGGSDDYSTDGYGEKVSSLWSNTDFTSSGKCTVKITGGTIGYIDTTTPSNSMYPYNSPAGLPYGNVFGGCRGEAAPDLDVTPSYHYSPEFFMGYVNETDVQIGKTDGNGPTILGSVYGGGMDGHVRRDASVVIKGGEIGIPYDATNKGTLGTDPNNILWLARGNVYGSGSGIGTYNANNIQYKEGYTGTKVTGTGNSTSAGSVTRFTKVDIQGGTIYRNVYGGGSLSSIGAPKINQTYDEYRKGDTNHTEVGKQTLNEVVISGGQIGDVNSYDTNGNYVYGGRVFGGSRGDATLDATKFSTSMFTSVSINANATPANSPVIYGSVFGGGEVGIVKGSVDVTMNGGTVNDDVYGGGALANTNTANVTSGYGTDSEVIGSTSTYTTTVDLFGGLIKGDAYGGGLGQLGTSAGTHYTQDEIDAANEGDPAYGKTTDDWKIPPVAASEGTGAIKAKVYGDVTVTLGDDGRNGATAFYVDKYTEGTHAGIVKSGRVFGCNNLNGSPQGSVTVTVNKTAKGNIDKTASGKLKSETASDHTYHVAAVYGGGNLAGKTVGDITNVIINGCDVSIRQVYGGGNAAEVPGTDVLVNGTWEIEQVFGGGNGKDDYTLDGGTTWITNPGANVNGNTNTLMKGGLIHEAYGGSNEKGTITGSVSINTSDDRPTDCDCELDVEKIVGAGKNADVNGDLIMVLGCKPTSKTPLVFGGADNANVNGNVELTITSGTFGQVFGGNNLGGIIKGHILLNIEETGCNPIKIDELYLGGNQAAYSVYGYYDSGTTDPATGKKIYLPRTSASDSHTADPSHADDATHSFPYADPVLNVVSCTSIGKVFGGGLGEGAVMYADPTVNINMIPGAFASDDSKGIPFVMNEKGLSADDNPKKLGIIGDVYGGGNAADVIGNPTVNIGTAATVQLHQSYSTTTGYVMSDPIPVEGAYINGNVFGGGMGSDDTYECEKAMVGINGDGEANPDGGTTVNIGNGVVMGSVYGGGEIGRVEKNSVVTIGLASGTSTPLIKGNVFGGGKGKETHGYAALLRGNPTVTIQADAKVLGNVYGGGEIASVARYKVPKTPAEVTAARAEGYDAVLDMPYALKNSTSGYCKVTVKGNAEIGPDNMKMYHADGNGNIPADDKPDDAGHVFAAGKGILPKNYPYGSVEDDDHMPKRMINENGVDKWQWFHSKADYVKFIQTLALSSNTEVTIEGNAFVKGSVYGGSENGLVQYDTKVYIKGGQIGNGDGVNRRYSDAEWAYDGSNDTKSLAECASWPYEAPYAPYDPNANATGDLDKYSSGKSTEGGRRLASDGHTYYGNVFGGGSGSVPYFDTDEGISKYLNSAGTVKGNTHVEISGGHILTSVYGGCEATNVQDTAYVTMTGGTVGIPRTLNQINNHPVTCYVFGGGKGDQRIFFNKDTNVGNAVVDIQGGRIYGSVFGGGEDGHVMRNVALTIGNDDGTGPTIGTWGTTYVDGNVFGGGRGFGGEALTAGNIGGSVTMNIKGGTMLGSIYGGGRLGSVGYGLYLVDEVVGEEKPYGVLRPDGVDDNGNPVEGFKRGYITINISGGTIGNEHEYKYYAPDVELTSDMKTAANIPNTTFDYQNHLLYTKGGNVFTGCMGRLYALDGSSLLPLWPKLGKCKETVLNITGGTIKSSVYGGGEIGAVQQKTTVNVTGGTVGTKVVDSEDETKYYYFGSVFGGGKGSTDAISYPAGTAEADKVDISEAGTVGGNVLVELNKGVAEDKPGGIVNQVFGCNDMNGSPKGMVDVHIYATQTVGKSNISTKLGKELGKYDVQAVYGGGNLAAYNPTDLTAGKAKVTIDGCGLSSIKQVYGGGNAASTPATEVTVNGTYEIEELFGGGNGADKLPSGSDNPGANVGFRAYLDNVEGKTDTPENRAANYGYGSGKAAVNVFGGTIHRVFGGSNTKGNVRKTAITMLEDKSECPFCVDEAYGGGKSAPMDAEAKLLMACIPGLKAVYGGAQAADVYDDVTLTITNGNFDRVFGGNNISGTIRGRIQVNIEETGCKPVIIGELYGGGNQAGYSVYGYNADGSLITSGDTPLYADPEVNVKSFTSIGNIYGGGYGTTATMVGNPIVNINEDEDATTDAQKHATAEYAGKTITLEANTENEHQVTLPKHTKGKMGAINNVFGGGNAAEVIGNTNVNIGTQTEGYMTVSDTDITVGTTDVSNFYTRTGTTTATYVYTQASGTAKDGVTYYKKYNVKGADIRGNVYGGGNNAQVTGNTNVNIGREVE